MKLKVLITSNIPAPYFVNYADELGKYVDLTVVFELQNAVDRDEKWKNQLDGKHFDYHILNAKRFGSESGLSFRIKKFLKDKSFDRIIIANPTTPTGIISLLYCRRRKIPFIIQSEGGFQGSGKGIKEHFKKYIMEKASMYLTGMGGDDDYFLKYGATKDRLKPYYFTSSYKKDISVNPISDAQKSSLKKELNISEEHVVLYVGQFIHRKGIDVLLKSFSEINSNASLYLIGGTPTDEYKNIIRQKNLKNIYFLPFLSKDEIKKYYQAADIFVMTTREDTWGLVVNEAMENGLPVITTTRCIAGKQLIENGVNGYLVEPDSPSAVHERIRTLLDNSNLRTYMSKNNIEKIKNHTIEEMAKTIFNYIR